MLRFFCEFLGVPIDALASDDTFILISGRGNCAVLHTNRIAATDGADLARNPHGQDRPFPDVHAIPGPHMAAFAQRRHYSGKTGRKRCSHTADRNGSGCCN